MEILFKLAAEKKNNPKIEKIKSLLADLPDDTDSDPELWDAIDSIVSQIELIKRVLIYLCDDEDEESDVMAVIEPILSLVGLGIEKKNIFAAETGKISKTEWKIVEAQKKFGGVKRSDLKDSDFLFPADKSFPLKTTQDVRDSISNFGHSRYSKTMTYDAFIHKLWNKAKSKGLENGIPQSTRDKYNLK